MSDKNVEVEVRGSTPYVNGVALAAYQLTSTQLLVGSSANVPTPRTVTGDVTIGNTGVTAIAADSIINADVKTNAAIDFSKLAALDDANLLVGSSAGVATKRAITGDVTISNTGVTTIGAGTVETAMVEAEAITPAKTSGVAVLYNLGAPDLADVDLIVTSTNMIVGAYTVAAQPDVPRNITVTATAAGAADTMGTITVVGTNYADAVIEEEIIPAAGSTVAGAKAFKTVTTVTGADWVINEGNDTIEVGIGDELGCHAIADATTDIMLGILGVTITAHNPTIASPVTLEGSTVDMSAGTYDGTKVAMVFQKN